MKSKDEFFYVLGCIRETIKKLLMDSWWEKKKQALNVWFGNR